MKALILGRSNKDYEALVEAIRGVIFLSTPHRGSNLADILNRILALSPMTSQKQYVQELNRGASFLEQINEQWRHFSPSLQIFSFYETLQTSVGPKSMVCFGRPAVHAKDIF